HHLIHAAAVYNAGQATHVVDKMTEKHRIGSERHMVDIAVQRLVQCKDDLRHMGSPAREAGCREYAKVKRAAICPPLTKRLRARISQEQSSQRLGRHHRDQSTIVGTATLCGLLHETSLSRHHHM